MAKKIRTKEVRESLLDYNTLANSLKENTESAVKDLLNEAVRDTYAKLLSESDDEDNDKDYDEEEVEDTNSEVVSDEEKEDGVDDNVESDAGMDDDSDGIDLEKEVDDVEDSDGDGWSEFEKYKISDDEYDFSNAEDDEIVKVYKLMKNDDQILVHKDDNGMVNVQDNETGAEYLISLDDDKSSDVPDDDVIEDGADDFGDEDDFENNIDDDMNESTEKMFELVLEYDSNVGYTDNYQKKDVMTNPGMSEPGKNVNDWDAGVPKGDSKPWSGYPGKKKKADNPFNDGKGKQVENEGRLFEIEMGDEGGDVDGTEIDGGNFSECGDMNDMPVEEATNVGGFVQQNSTSKSHVPNSNGRDARSKSQDGRRKKGTVTPRYSGTDEEGVSESLKRRINNTIRENKELKGTLGNIMKSLKEAAVTNHNLAQIIKLISENSTTQDEKKEIISKFAKQAKTIKESKALYEAISDDLKKAKKMNITEGTNLSATSSKKINETTIYKSNDVLESLDLMYRMMK